jgi:hypothetical protein
MLPEVPDVYLKYLMLPEVPDVYLKYIECFLVRNAS